MALKRSLTSTSILDLLDQDDVGCKESSGEEQKAEAIKRREAEVQRRSDETYLDLMGKLQDVENNESDNIKKRKLEDKENTFGTLKSLKMDRQGDPTSTSSKSGKVDKNAFNSDPFNEVADRSVERLRAIMNRKKPVAGGITSFNPFQPKWQPNPTTMARWILEDMKAPQLKAHLKANWLLVKARDRLKGAPTTKKPILELLIPILAQKIERDRVN